MADYNTFDEERVGKRHRFTWFQRISQIILTLILLFVVLVVFFGSGFEGVEGALLMLILMGLGVSLLLLAHVELLTRIPPVSDIEQSIDDIKYGVDDIKQSMDSDRHFKSND